MDSVFRADAQGVRSIFTLKGAKNKDTNGNMRYGVNLLAVWGSMATGGGGSKLDELLCTLAIPCMAKKQKKLSVGYNTR